MSADLTARFALILYTTAVMPIYVKIMHLPQICRALRTRKLRTIVIITFITYVVDVISAIKIGALRLVKVGTRLMVHKRLVVK